MLGKTNATSQGTTGGSSTYQAKLVLKAVVEGGAPQDEETIVNEANQVLEKI